MRRTLVHSLIKSRPHLTLAIGFGIVAGYFWPGQHAWLQRTLIGWNAGVWPYLMSMSWMMVRASPHKVRSIASREDENAGLILGTLLVAALLSVTAIVTELARLDHPSPHVQAQRYAFTALTVIGSWLLVGVLFTFHYAHLYYRAPGAKPPLRFPDEKLQPDYWDFLYFSFTIAVAVQTSDVAIASRGLRKVALAQSLLAFFFNLAILGLSVNIAASLVNA